MRCLNSITRLARSVFALTILGVFLGVSPCYAGPANLWASSYWQEFQDYWEGIFRRQDGVIMTVLIAGAIALFIITRVKGNKG